MCEVSKHLADGIRIHLETQHVYTFRPIRIDNVYCYAVIYKSPQIVNFESVNVWCKIPGEQAEKYSLFYKRYNSIDRAIQIVTEVSATYKIYNGDLVHPLDYDLLRFEEKFIPYESHQECCVCTEPTQETTLCNHYLCFHCRDACLIKEQVNCPLCRKEKVVKYFNVDHRMLNNVEYPVLDEVRKNNAEYESGTDTSEASEASEHMTDESDESESITEEADEPIDYRVVVYNRQTSQSSDGVERLPLYYHTPPFAFLWNFRRNY